MRIAHLFGSTIATKTLMLGEYAGAISPLPYATANWFRNVFVKPCCTRSHGMSSMKMPMNRPGKRKVLKRRPRFDASLTSPSMPWAAYMVYGMMPARTPIQMAVL